MNGLSKFVAFDLEFHEAPNGIQILCAASMSTDDAVPFVWFDNDNGHIADSLSEYTLANFVQFLMSKVNEGFCIVTWGGVGADFRHLCKLLPGLASEIKTLCLNSVDVPFASGSSIGMMMGLGSAAQALGIGKKTNDSATIPSLWTSSRHEVLQHVSTDTYLTVAVVRNAIAHNELHWITSRGIRKTWCPAKLVTVRACLQMPLPNVPFQLQDCMNPKMLSRWILD
jgi:hypothetical protein